MNMYKNIKSCVFVNGVRSEFFVSLAGVRQGDNLSPLLFALFIINRCILPKGQWESISAGRAQNETLKIEMLFFSCNYRLSGLCVIWLNLHINLIEHPFLPSFLLPPFLPSSRLCRVCTPNVSSYFSWSRRSVAAFSTLRSRATEAQKVCFPL